MWRRGRVRSRPRAGWRRGCGWAGGGSTCCGCCRSASWSCWRASPRRRACAACRRCSGSSPRTRALDLDAGGGVGRPGVGRAGQHFFNLFFLLFIMRSGLQILSDHPRLYWTRHSTPGRDWFRIQKPVPADPLWTAKQDSISLPGQVGLPGLRHSIGLARWWHLGVNTLWLAQRPALLRPAVRHRRSGDAWSRRVGRAFPHARVGGCPVPVAGLAARQRLGRLQRPAAVGLLHHRVRRRAAGGAHRAGHVTGAVDPLQAHQHGC